MVNGMKPTVEQRGHESGGAALGWTGIDRDGPGRGGAGVHGKQQTGRLFTGGQLEGIRVSDSDCQMQLLLGLIDSLYSSLMGGWSQELNWIVYEGKE